MWFMQFLQAFYNFYVHLMHWTEKNVNEKLPVQLVYQISSSLLNSTETHQKVKNSSCPDCGKQKSQ